MSAMAVKKAKAGKKATGKASKPPSRAASKESPKKTSSRASSTPSSKAKPAEGGLELDPRRIEELLRRLRAAYPRAECALHHHNAWELLVATILSAQCTDARVNMVTPALFKKFPTPTDFAHAPLVEIEEQIRSTGFYHNKAKSLNGAARKLTAEFNGKVPQTMEELLTLPGVARKTANVVLGVAFAKAVGGGVDTHVLRLSRCLELTTATEPIPVEKDLMKIIPQDHWITFYHEMIYHCRH